MNPPIARQLRVKGGGENPVLADQDRIISPAPENLDGHITPRDSGSADEDPLHPRWISKVGGEVDLGDGRKDLAPIGVTFDVDREHPETGLCRHHRLGEEDDPCAGGEDSHSRPGSLYNPAREIFGLHQPQHR